jgi:Carboxypeptidase regulatory-like domain/TonB dependent receptor-like, beta-barrel
MQTTASRNNTPSEATPHLATISTSKIGKTAISLIVLLAFCIIPAVWAQLPTATILGVVKDASGAVVPGATVTARNVDTGQTRSLTTEGDGSYRFNALPVGNYEVRVERQGFQAAVRSGLTLTVSQEAVLNFALQVGTATQTVAVTAEAPLVDTTSGSLGGTVNEQKVSDLPLNGRNYIDLVLLQPGVSLDTNRPQGEATWYSSNGASVRSNYYMLDGTPTRNLYGTNPSSMTATALGVDGVREFRVITNAFSAEYGMSMGSQMVIVSKGGTNQFHGDLFEYLRNSVLDARNFFDYTTDRRLPEFIRNQFGGSIGGPIQKNKTFFFGTWESLHERLGTTNVVPSVPGAGCHGPAGALITVAACPQLEKNEIVSQVTAPLLALFPLPNLPGNNFTFPFSQPTLENYTQERVDHTFSEKDTIFARFTGDWASRNIVQQFPQFYDAQKSQLYFVTLSENHIFTPTLLNTARYSWSGTRLNTGGPLPYDGPQYSLVPGMPLGQINLLGNTFGPDVPIPLYENQYIWSWSDDMFYTHGKHSMKYGTLINRITQEPVGPAFLRGAVTFGSLDNFLLGIPSNYHAITPGSDYARKYRNETYGFYFQDDYRVTPRFTLNLGLRYEFNTVPREVNGKEASLRNVRQDAAQTIGPLMVNNSLHNFSPRFGFAWDVFGDGKTAVRGGWALLYDISNIGSALITVGNGQPPYSSSSSVRNSTNSVMTLPLVFPESAVGKNLQLIDYNLKQPSMQQYNLTIERQLPGQMVLSLAYAGSRGYHIVHGTEGNPEVPQGVPSNGVCVPLPAGQSVNLNAPTCFLGNDPRTNPNWSTIAFRTANTSSWYNSAQVGVLKRLSRGLEFQGSYTLSKSIDQIENQLGSDQGSGEAALQTDPTHPYVDQGLSSFNATHNFRFNAIYHLPTTTAKGFVGALANGWWVSGIESLQSGFPFTPCLQNNQSLSGVGGGSSCVDRPNLNAGRTNSNITSGTTAGCPGVAAGQKLGTANLFFDPCAFSLQPMGFLGNAGRNILSGPGLANLDFSAVKDTRIPFLGEAGSLQFRAEIFNIFNHTNLGFSPIDNADRVVFSGSKINPAAGVMIGTATPSRQIQFALKLIF